MLWLQFFSSGLLQGMASRQVHGPNSHPAIKADVTPAVCSSAAEHADSGYIWYATFPRCTHMLMSESPHPRGGGSPEGKWDGSVGESTVGPFSDVPLTWLMA